jgi:hypothetical protein
MDIENTSTGKKLLSRRLQTQRLVFFGAFSETFLLLAASLHVFKFSLLF